MPSLRRENDYYYILFSSLSFLCLFLEGKQDQGLTFLKEIRKNVDNDYFKESPQISLVKDIIIAVRDKNDQYLTKIEREFNQYSLKYRIISFRAGGCTKKICMSDGRFD